MPKSVSIIILTKNAGDRLDSVIKAAFNNAGQINLDFIIVDSGSTDNTKRIISKYPVRLIEIPPYSFGHGRTRNLAAENAAGEFMVFLTQDALPKDENWLSNLLKNFADSSVAGVFARQIADEDSSPLEKFFLSWLYPDFKIVKQSVDPANCLLSEIFFSNVSSCIRRSEWENHKFNELMIMSEDQDWSKRILMEGKKIVYEPSAVVYHSHKYRLLELIQRNFDSGMSLRGLVNAPLKRSLNYQLKYLRTGCLFFLKNGMYPDIIKFIVYETFRMFGFFLGFHSICLPLFFKKRISQNKIYWLSESKHQR